MPSPAKHKRRSDKNARFATLETIDSNIAVLAERTPEPTRPEVVAATLPSGVPEKEVPVTKITALPTTFDQACLPAPQEIVVPPAKSNVASKSPAAKLAKKNRWSFRSKSTAVAV